MCSTGCFVCAQTHHGVRDNLDVEGSATTGFDRRLRSDSWHCGNSHGRGSAQKRLQKGQLFEKID
jgi:hypothetical protein